jgi:hypothetical protein
MLLTVPGCSGRIARSLQLGLTLLNLSSHTGVVGWVGVNSTAARVGLRHIGVAVASARSAKVVEGNLGLASGTRGLGLGVVELTVDLHYSRDLWVSRMELSE